MLKKTVAALVAACVLLVAAQVEAGGFRSRTVVRNFGGGRRVVVNQFATPLFVQPTFVAPQFAQPTFVPVQPNVFVPFGFSGGFQVNSFGCH